MSQRHVSRRRRRARLAVLGVVILGLVALGVWLLAARAVVPGVTARLNPISYTAEIARSADRYNIDPYLVAAVARAESDFNPKAVSAVGAVGVMQIMPDTAVWIVRLDTWKGPSNPDLKVAADSLELGSCYLAFLLKQFDQDSRAAVAAYNAGQGAVSGWLAEIGRKDPGTKAALAISDIPFGETRAFVQKVEHYRLLFQDVHPDAFRAATGALGVASYRGRASR